MTDSDETAQNRIDDAPAAGPAPVAYPQVVNPDGSPVTSSGDEQAEQAASAADDRPGKDAEDIVGQVEEPAKVMRIGGMIKKLLEEVRDTPLDDAARTRLAEVHARSIKELEGGLSPDLMDELHRITLPFSDTEPPSDAEIRVAHAQLVGWLEGLFHGIQTALVAQQMAAQAQLTGMRRALPPGAQAGHGPFPPQGPGQGGDQQERGPGQYL
ncbi:bacterial proteasome activator family protein [Myceligenerans crystallogenes]|uniref:Bacterial proteasome activator n=1 Tax=Myceligenerans crystallogenes TaxID=316335 RepID=A0ABP4ZMH8_9MICO